MTCFIMRPEWHSLTLNVETRQVHGEISDGIIGC